MSDKINKTRRGFIAYLDEKNEIIEGNFEIVSFDQFLIRFKTSNNLITLPVARVLKVKEKEEWEE